MYENPYNKPEAHGLEIIGETQWGEADYSFNLTVVWRHKETGQLYYADDSGCSCPSPFEDFRDLASLTAATRHEVLAHLGSFKGGQYSGGTVADAIDLIGKVAALR